MKAQELESKYKQMESPQEKKKVHSQQQQRNKRTLEKVRIRP